ncbi:anthranilate synthase component 1 [Persicimonas caeni]|uniref:anthranilate synthase n=1 Tax=Persicimonas caeni TaxID=2292766 RepID=A0A4Y6Q2L3_PERCE|nr:anthranilate synthase component 1 [Persicimonas caeni]QDG54245.1 anthranilate synthase component 1 [Persicimonas caeni]QED35466.1 anthranilate synthase component 1 [Persicimonas caeni]
MRGPNLQQGQVLPISRRVPKAPDPLELFARLTDAGERADAALLESADGAEGRHLRSMLVTKCAVRATCRAREVMFEALSANGESALEHVAERLGEFGEVRDEAGALRFVPETATRGGSEAHRLRAPSSLDALRAMAFGWELVSSPGPLSMVCPGVFAYELIDEFEALPEPRGDATEYPDFVFWLPEETVVIDHTTGATRAIRHVYAGSQARASYHDAMNALEGLCAAVEAAPAAAKAERVKGARLDEEPQVEVDIDEATFGGAVEELKGHIAAGDIFQAVPSRTFRAACSDPLASYRRLRAENPSPYMFYVRREEDVLFGASPETSVKVSQCGRGEPKEVEIRPIAGTRPRGFDAQGRIDADLDARMEAELRLDTKELAEHMMLVDLARNDVARVSRPGTREVSRLLGVDRYSHVMHLVSHVRGELADGLDALHAYAGSMNMGTLVGAPKLRAAELIRRFEVDRRGPYGGAVGYLTPDGEMDTAIVIRSALVRDGVAHVRAGAGVVADSQPALEADETRRKARAVLRALGGAGRTAKGAKGAKDAKGKKKEGL